MNRKTRDKFATPTQKVLTAGNAILQTPPAVFSKLNTDFGPFEIDLTASLQDHLCPTWFGPDGVKFDALKANWTLYGTKGYSNPPYGPFVGKMLLKAKEEAARGFESTLLLPVRITKAFRLHVLCGATYLLFCDKRIAFWENGAPKINPETGKPDGALFDSMIIRYLPGQRFSAPRAGVWKVPFHDK